MISRTRNPRHGRPRRGAVTAYLIVILIVLLMAFALAVDYASLWQYRVELQIGADAASTAAIQTFVDEELLKDTPDPTIDFLALSRAQAVQFAQFHTVQGMPLVLDPNASNDPAGDIVLGTVDLAVMGHPFSPSGDAKAINTVLVTARRTQAGGNPVVPPLSGFNLLPFADVIASAKATLDRDIIGFRPLGSRPLPLVPIAILSDPSAINIGSWENRVVNEMGLDVYQFDRSTMTVVAGSDTLHEIDVQLLPTGLGNGSLLKFGGGTDAEYQAQVEGGVTSTNLVNLGGQLLLDTNNEAVVPGTDVGPVSGSSQYTALHDALLKLETTAERRVWPLFSTVSGGNVTLVGFVAARVVDVGPDTLPISFTLQPTMMAVSTALTNPAQRGVNGALIPNPYIVKVRLVE